MTININEYKKFRINKLKEIKKNISKCQNINLQIGGEITQKDIDIKYNEIRNKILNINNTISLLEDSNENLNSVVESQNNNIVKVNQEISNLESLITNNL